MYTVVLGAQFGDEGKGKIVDYLMDKYKYDACVRYNGGSNAGHTIDINGTVYHTHVLPSGLLHDNMLNIMGNGMVIGLENLQNELEDLTNEGLNLVDRLKISDRAHVVLNIHKHIDKITGKKVGTTGQGIGIAYSNKCLRTNITVSDIVNDSWENKLIELYKYYNQEDNNLYLCDCALINSSKTFLQNNNVNLSYLLNNSEMNIIFEGANGTMLDIDHGTYPYVTSSSCNIYGVFSGTGLCPANFYKKQYQILGVTKAYSTRVGNGPFVTEVFDDEYKLLQEKGCEFGVTTSRKRRCGWMDLVQLKYSLMINGFTELNLTKLDVLSCFDTIKICTRYKNKETNKVTMEVPSSDHEVNNIVPVYHEVNGWKDYDITTAKSYDDLHPNIQNYIYIIEQYLGICIKYINTGPERNQIIIR